MIDPDEYVNIAEAARLTGVSRQALHSKVTRGRIPYRVIGGHRLIGLKDLYEYVENPPPRDTTNIRRGSNNVNSKLTEEDVCKIRKAREGGALLRELSEEYGVALMSIWKITTRRAWRHVE